MNQEALGDLERKKIEEVARDYQRRGYEVIREPRDMPAFVASLRPDLVAILGDDKVVIEIKVGREAGDRAHLPPIAKAVNQHAGWRFELVTIEAPPQQTPFPLISLQAIRERLDDAAILSKSNEVAAFLLAWTAIEALLRRILGEDKSAAAKMSPVRMVKTARAEGLVSQAASDVLVNAANLRNAVAHGFTGDETLLRAKALEAFLREAAELLAQAESDQQPTGDDGDDITADEIVEWFFDHYEDPANGVPYESAEGGYIYIFGGPYDAEDVIYDQFPDAPQDAVEKAVEEIQLQGVEWIKKGQYA